MQYEKIIKDERGKVRLVVTLIIDQWYSDSFSYNVRSSVIPPKKRTEVWDNSITTDKEKLDAKIEFWNLLKPIN